MNNSGDGMDWLQDIELGEDEGHGVDLLGNYPEAVAQIAAAIREREQAAYTRGYNTGWQKASRKHKNAFQHLRLVRALINELETTGELATAQQSKAKED